MYYMISYHYYSYVSSLKKLQTQDKFVWDLENWREMFRQEDLH